MAKKTKCYRLMGKSAVMKKFSEFQEFKSKKEAEKGKKRKEKLYDKVSPNLEFKFKIQKC